MSGTHVESHVPQNSRVTPASFAELLPELQWSTASPLNFKILTISVLFCFTVFWMVSTEVPGCRSHRYDAAEVQTRLKKKKAPRLQVNTLPSTASHRPLSWHTERECSPTPDAILLFLEVGQSQQRFTSCFLFVCGPSIPHTPPPPNKITSPCDKPTSDETNLEQTKHSWSEPQLLPQRHFFSSARPEIFFSLVKTSIWLYFKSADYFWNISVMVPGVGNILFTMSRQRR